MINLNIFTSVNNSLVFRIFTMHHDRIDICTGICSGKNQTNLSNITMSYIRHTLLKLISINRECINIAMLNKKLCGLTRFSIIKGTVSIHTFILIVKQDIAKNFIRIVMLMVPNKRNLLTIVMLKCILHDCSSISTFKVILRNPTTKIILLHFDFLLLSHHFH